jgi:hypothetical protein
MLQKNPTLLEWGLFNLKTSYEKFKHSFPIQASVDVAAVGVVCSLNFSFQLLFKNCLTKISVQIYTIKL